MYEVADLTVQVPDDLRYGRIQLSLIPALFLLQHFQHVLFGVYTLSTPNLPPFGILFSGSVAVVELG